MEIYDQMAEAASTGQPYRTPLDPPPVDLGEDRPATVTLLRPRTPEEPAAPALAAEEQGEYAPESTEDHHAAELENEDSGATATEETRSPEPETEREAPDEQKDGAPEAPNLYHATLALHACLPDGQKVEREALLYNAARELGHEKLTRKVRRALNKALAAENKAGRLRTDWEQVWRPRKK